MKKATEVNGQNITAILGYLKNYLKGKNSIEEIIVRTGNFNKVHGLLSPAPENVLVKKNESFQDSIKIERLFDAAGEKYIAIRGNTRRSNIVNIGDKIVLSSLGVLILRKDIFNFGFPSFIYVWKVK